MKTVVKLSVSMTAPEKFAICLKELDEASPSELKRLNAIEHEIEKLEAVIAERKSELKTKRALTPK